LATGLAKRRITKGVFFSHLGRVATADLIPQFADFGLQAEGVEWSVVSGVVGEDLHVSVRNVGYVRGAGDVARAALGDLGSAGGHRTMAKAVFPVDSLFPGAASAGSPAETQDRIVQRFLRAIGTNGRSVER
jgi:nanoRNase/pAp phosphatase (c-di-AMP/oligoRNAs hydrolase)